MTESCYILCYTQSICEKTRKMKKSKLLHCNNLLSFGQARLELATPSPPDLYANHLRYCPKCRA